MELCVDGQKLSIAQLGPDFLLLDQPINYPPADAEINISVDGRRHCRCVYLPDGITVDQPVTRLAYRRSRDNQSTIV